MTPGPSLTRALASVLGLQAPVPLPSQSSQADGAGSRTTATRPYPVSELTVGPSGPSPSLVRVHPDATADLPLVIAAAGAYIPPLSQAVIAWKDHGRAELLPYLSSLMAAGLRELLDRAAGVSYPLALAPVPATALRVVSRGDDLIHGLAAAATRHLAAEVPRGSLQVRRVLARVRPRDQVGLGATARLVNAHDSYRARKAIGRGHPIVLLDDIATTGATLAACARALTAREWHVVGAVVICATKAVPLPPRPV